MKKIKKNIKKLLNKILNKTTYIKTKINAYKKLDYSVIGL